MLYRLIFLSGNLKGQRVTVDSEPMSIGRDPDCAIRIDDTEAASKHASLEHNAVTGLRIQDLGSMNKILVNNRETRESHLKHGDIVGIGRTRFLVQASVETDLTKKAPKSRTRNISLTPLLIIIPLLAVIYAVVSFCQKIIHESTRPVLPVAIVTAISNTPPRLVTETRIVTNKNNIAGASVSNENLKPISEEIKKMQQDLVGIKQTVKELSVKTPAMAVSNETAIAKETRHLPESAPAKTIPVIAAPVKAAPIQSTGQRQTQPIDPQIRITYMEQQKFKENEDFDEMRVVTIGLYRSPDAKDTDDNLIRVEVSFYDQSANGQSIVPTRAVVPAKPLKPMQWLQETQSMVTAAYVIPKGTRNTSSTNLQREQFYGYVVRVFYGNRLQDEDARPKNLLYYSTGTSAAKSTTDNFNKTEQR